MTKFLDPFRFLLMAVLAALGRFCTSFRTFPAYLLSIGLHGPFRVVRTVRSIFRTLRDFAYPLNGPGAVHQSATRPLTKVSPLYHVDDIRSPLLIGQGQNDPRVTIANVDAMVAALRKEKRDVIYVVYPDEGHGFARPENNLDFYGRVDEFLAKYLGGRSEPWEKVVGATAEVRY